MCQHLGSIEGGDRKSLNCLFESLSASQRLLLSAFEDLSQLPLPPYHLVEGGLSSTAPQLGENKLQPHGSNIHSNIFISYIHSAYLK